MDYGDEEEEDRCTDESYEQGEPGPFDVHECFDWVGCTAYVNSTWCSTTAHICPNVNEELVL